MSITLKHNKKDKYRTVSDIELLQDLQKLGYNIPEGIINIQFEFEPGSDIFPVKFTCTCFVQKKT